MQKVATVVSTPNSVGTATLWQISNGENQRIAMLFTRGVDAFPHHHGIVHHNAKSHDKTECGHLV